MRIVLLCCDPNRRRARAQRHNFPRRYHAGELPSISTFSPGRHSGLEACSCCPTTFPFCDQPRLNAASPREELVSTMDAERALRIQRVEVPRIKALVLREGPILFA